MNAFKQFAIFSAIVLILFSCVKIKNPFDDGNYFPTPVYPSPYDDPSWSADGKTIVFYRMKVTHIGSIGDFSVDPDSTGLWAINADGSNMRLLLQGMYMGSPELSPDGAWLVYEEGGQIYKVPFVDGVVDTTNIVQLTTEGRNFFPAWSPDGKKIAYDSDVDDTKFDIWIMSYDGENKKNISQENDSLDQGGWRKPSWCPDGNWIIHERYISGGEIGTEIFVMDTCGTNAEWLEHGANPKYSQDGLRIAFDSNSQIFVMNSDGTDLTQVTTEGSSTHPSWSPDGRIVYVHFVSRKRDINNGTLWIMDADGSNSYQFTFNYGLVLD